MIIELLKDKSLTKIEKNIEVDGLLVLIMYLILWKLGVFLIIENEMDIEIEICEGCRRWWTYGGSGGLCHLLFTI